ncbi:MAG: carbamoyltransferase [Flavobacteriia bacterium]|nr:carbamoyltransferase [Flavobacteriia bacterium]
MKILGISAFYHDAAAALIIDGEVVSAVQEERFTREKHTPDFPIQSIKYCLNENGLSIDELDAVCFYDKPLLKFERLLQTYYTFSPKGLFSFLKAIPVWIKDKIFLKKLIKDSLNKVEAYDKKKLKLLFSEHHLSHSASAFFVSPFEESVILTIDGVGEWTTSSIGVGKGNDIIFLKEMEFPHSLGLLYSAFTYYLGFTVNSGEYKLMGLAPYGNPNSVQTNEFIEKIKNEIVDIKQDGSIWLNQTYFKYAYGLKMCNEVKWSNLFQIKKRNADDEILPIHCNLALAIQKVTEEIVLKMCIEAKKITQMENICLAGGVALNCVANGVLLKSNIFKNIYIQPASGDAGGALGSALSIYYMYFNQDRQVKNIDGMSGSYLGPDFSEKEINLMNKKVKAQYTYFSEFTNLCEFISEKLSEGNVVGWFQDKMEFGPRALGNRSILADPRNPEMQKKINLKIKYREGFRPFAPAVLFEEMSQYFDISTSSPYMLFVAPVLEKRRVKKSENYEKLSLWEKLYQIRSDIQAVTHLDYSARIQSVHKETNPKFWQLIHSYKKLTGMGLLVNTSFNVRGEPIVCSPDDAFRCFMSTDMDYLVIENFVYYKKEQIEWENKEKWSVKFKMD